MYTVFTPLFLGPVPMTGVLAVPYTPTLFPFYVLFPSAWALGTLPRRSSVLDVCRNGMFPPTCNGCHESVHRHFSVEILDLVCESEPDRERKVFGAGFLWDVALREPRFRKVLPHEFPLMGETGMHQCKKSLFCVSLTCTRICGKVYS